MQVEKVDKGKVVVGCDGKATLEKAFGEWAYDCQTNNTISYN